MAGKVLKVKLWDDDSGTKWKKNVQEIEGEVLCGEFSSRTESVYATSCKSISGFELSSKAYKSDWSHHATLRCGERSHPHRA